MKCEGSIKSIEATPQTMIVLSELAEINPRACKPKLNPDAEVSFIPMADVDEAGQWVNRQTAKLKDVSIGYTQFLENDILFAKITPCAENGKGTHATNLVNSIGYGSTEFHVLRPRKNVNPRFVFQLAHWPYARTKAASMMSGSAGQQRVTTDFFECFGVPRSAFKDQNRIVELLDSIDVALFRAQDILKQTQQVKAAALQGLMLPFKNAKSSFRIEMLGMLFAERKEPGEPGLPTLSVTMHDGMVDRDDLARRVESELTPEEHLLAHKDDIAYNMMRMWQGVSGLAPCRGLVSPAYVVLRPLAGIDPLFASYLFKLPETIRLFHRYSQGLTNDRLRLYYDQFAEIRVPIPADLAEQQRIARLLSTLDQHIARSESVIAALRQAKAGICQEIFS